MVVGRERRASGASPLTFRRREQRRASGVSPLTFRWREQRAAALGVLLLVLSLWPLLARAVGRPTSAQPAAVSPRAEVPVAVVVTDARDLAAFEATISYDPAVISPTAIVAGPFLPSGSVLLPPDNHASGRLAIGSYSLGGHVASGDGVLATVGFAVLRGGTPDLELELGSSGVFGRHGQPVPGTLGLQAAWRACLPLVSLDRR